MSGNCVRGTDGCVNSPNYPLNYGDSQQCNFTMPAWNLRVEEFNTEASYDKLTINGLFYAGTVGPDNVIPTGFLIWSSDGSETSTGWKICTEDADFTTTTSSTPVDLNPRRRRNYISVRRRRSSSSILSDMAPVRLGKSSEPTRCVYYSEPVECESDAAGSDWTVTVEQVNDRTKVCAQSTSGEHWNSDALDFRCKAADAVPLEFDARIGKWAHCASTIGHIRDQGRCGSCWAFAAAATADSRLCIQDPRFSGENAYISAGFLASCSAGRATVDGCSGGYPSKAMQWLGEIGAPTGYASHSGCSPYWATGDARHHFEGSAVISPTCPLECENAGYSRNIGQDLFKPSSLTSFIKTNDMLITREAIYRSGPVAIAFGAYGAFFNYNGGIYSPGCDAQANHAVLGLGFGPGYILALNSYGDDWGPSSDRGMFKVQECAVRWSVLPYEPAWEESLPLPLPEKVHYLGTPRRRRRGDPPPVLPTAKPGTPGQAWTQVSGNCALHQDGCAMSPNFPQPYGANEHCVFDAGNGSHPVSVFDFSTERHWDYMELNGKRYSGIVTIPNGLLVSGTVTWSTDGDFENLGWKICPSSSV